MNIYDFDKTIYDGDSTLDFFKFCLQKNKKVLLTLPNSCFAFVLYILKLKNKEYFKSTFLNFIKYFPNLDSEVELFWNKNENKIKKFYIENHLNTDIIISASPQFLLEVIAKRLRFNLIATEVNLKNGKIIGNNCYGFEKVERLKKIGIYKCEKFYSDSRSDEPLKKIAKSAFLVKGNDIFNWV